MTLAQRGKLLRGIWMVGGQRAKGAGHLEEQKWVEEEDERMEEG